MKKDFLQDLYGKDDGIPNSLENLICLQHLSLPQNSINLLAKIFTEKANQDRLKPYTDRLLAAAQAGLKGDSDDFPINTFPFGARTKGVYPEFIGVCAGEEAILHALVAIDGYCKQVAESFPPDELKTVVLLTDKWDSFRFQRDYEYPFANYMLQHNIFFVFLLVTDYGISRIPFLVGNELELQELRNKELSIELEHPGVTALTALKQTSPCYFEQQNRVGETIRYEFDFRKKQCTISGTNIEPQTRRITPVSARRFAMDVCEFMQTTHHSEPGHKEGTNCYRAGVFGNCFEWEVGSELDETCQRLFGAFRVLISSLVKT